MYTGWTLYRHLRFPAYLAVRLSSEEARGDDPVYQAASRLSVRFESYWQHKASRRYLTEYCEQVDVEEVLANEPALLIWLDQQGDAA